MKTSGIIIAHPSSDDKFEALKAFMKALKIKFEIATTDKPYNPDFVDMVLDSEKEIKNGKGKKVSSKGFDALWK